jgi:LPXTG-site transpeptidase (sortase) family protein
MHADQLKQARQYLRIRIAFVAVVTMIAYAFSPQQVRALSFTQEPTRIIIPTADIDLSVQTAKIAYNTWEVSSTTASFGQGSAIPGTLGNTVIFAHARPGLFGTLPQVTVGDQIHVFTSTDWFAYQVTEVLVVNPDDTQVIKYRNATELTLFTCIGRYDSHRLVIKATLLSNPF